MDHIVKLNDYEVRLAMECGRRRNDEAVARNYRQTDGSNAGNALKNHQRGVASEIAVAKFLSIEDWSPTFNGYRRVPDLPDLEIRSTTPSRPYLRIKVMDSKEKQERVFMLVTRLGECRFRIEGYIQCVNGLKKEFFLESDPDSKKPEWHVPINILINPDSLFLKK